MSNLPSHLPIYIDLEEIANLRTILLSRGYQWTFFQIVKPKQLFGLVKEVQYGDQMVEHHVRCYTSGKITTEIELKRIDEMWLHLTSHSISAHEYIIPILEEEDISYQIDQNLRKIYETRGPTEFTRDFLEFFRWLFKGVIFWSPLGFLWLFWAKVTGEYDRLLKYDCVKKKIN